LRVSAIEEKGRSTSHYVSINDVDNGQTSP
jgi:hypothetical protein